MGTNQPHDVAWVTVKIGLGKLFGAKGMEKTRGNLCLERFGVAFIELGGNCWTPNRRQQF